jgi:hypothetical protein
VSAPEVAIPGRWRSLRERLARLAWAALVLLALLAWVTKIAVAAGAPQGSLTFVLRAAATAAILAVLLRTRGRPAWLDGPRLVLVLLGLYFFPLVYDRVGGDGYEYYVQLRSPFFDHDFDFANDFEGLGARPPISEGAVSSRVPVGAALVWLPTYAIAHLAFTVVDWFGAGIPRDGFSPPYQATITSTTYVMVFLALLLLEAAVRRRSGPQVALLAVGGAWLCSPLPVYMVMNPSMSHGPSVVAATLMVVAWLSARAGTEDWRWAIVGFAGGLLAVIRIQDAVLLIPPALDLMTGTRGRPRRARLFVVGPAVFGLLQVLAWLRIHGPGFVVSVARLNAVGHSRLEVLNLLFSARHGLFTWTPMALLAVLGLLLMLRRERRLGALLLLGVGLSVIVNSAMEDWWGSDSFGQRRLLALTPLFALGLAEAASAAVRRPLVLLFGSGIALAIWNWQLAVLYNQQVLGPRDEALTLDRLASAEVEKLYGTVAGWEPWLPGPVFFYLYDGLRGVYLDEGVRSLRGVVDLGNDPPEPPGVVGESWYRPEKEGEIGFRRLRGRVASLRIPLRTPAEFRLVVRARSEMKEGPVQLGLEVNGHELGQVPLASEWGDAVFLLPANVVRPGFNDLRLLASTTPREVHADYHGKNAALSVDFVRFERQLTSARNFF